MSCLSDYNEILKLLTIKKIGLKAEDFKSYLHFFFIELRFA